MFMQKSINLKETGQKMKKSAKLILSPLNNSSKTYSRLQDSLIHINYKLIF
jgi:hypothetical protein